MGKYDPLGAFLAGKASVEVPMTFLQIEALIGAPLPPAARRHRAWWSNNPDNSVITRTWRNAGYRAFQVDMAGGALVFRRDEGADPAPSPSAAPDPLPQTALLERLRARLAGTVKIPYGVDLSEPAGDVWDAEIQ
jgi:hypothetical protein